MPKTKNLLDAAFDFENWMEKSGVKSAYLDTKTGEFHLPVFVGEVVHLDLTRKLILQSRSASKPKKKTPKEKAAEDVRAAA